MVPCLHLYMTIGKTIALMTGTFVSKMMSLLFHMLPRFVIAFLPRRKCFSISWLQSLSTVILENNKINKISHCFHFFHFCLPWNDGTGYHDLRFLNVEVRVSFFTLLSPASGSLLGINTRTKQSNDIQFWCTPYPILNQSVVPCPVLTVAPWTTYRFLRRQIR